VRADPFAALGEAIRERRGLVLFLGDAATGKTLLVRRLLQDIRPRVRAIDVPRAPSFDEIVGFVGERVGFDAKGGALEARLAAVHTLLALETRAGANIVLVVEDAHLLPRHVLVALPRLLVPRDAGGFAAQVLCVGRPELDGAFDRDVVRIRVPRHEPENVVPNPRVERAPTARCGYGRRNVALSLAVAATAMVAIALTRHGPRDRPPDAIAEARTTGDRLPAPSAEETLYLVDACRRAYEARDVARVRELLAPAKRGAEIVALPEGAHDVLYLQPLSRLVPRGGTTELRGPFVVRYRDGSGRVAELRGTAVWRVARRDGVARIVDVVHHVGSHERPTRQRAGSSIRMRVPRPRWLSMSSRPPWRSTTERAIAIPSPVPCALVV
jgi:hypothetical protein